MTRLRRLSGLVPGTHWKAATNGFPFFQKLPEVKASPNTSQNSSLKAEKLQILQPATDSGVNDTPGLLFHPQTNLDKSLWQGQQGETRCLWGISGFLHAKGTLNSIFRNALELLDAILTCTGDLSGRCGDRIRKVNRPKPFFFQLSLAYLARGDIEKGSRLMADNI